MSLSVGSVDKKQQVSNTQSQGDNKPAGSNFDDQLTKLREEYQNLIEQKDNVRDSDKAQSVNNDKGSDNNNNNKVSNEKGNNEDENKASLQTRADLVKVQIQYMEGQQTQNQASTDDKNKKAEV